jgi:hypothetical protein
VSKQTTTESIWRGSIQDIKPKMDMRFGTWTIRSMYRAGSLRAVGEEISKYKLDSVGVQEVS